MKTSPRTPRVITREQWLRYAVALLTKRFAKGDRAITVPPVQVSCSWPGGGSPAKRIGECWPRAASKAGVNEIFISPKLESPAKVLQILVHELAHAVDDCKNGHRAPFVAIAGRMGCVGKPTSAMPDDIWATMMAAAMVKKYGPFPHRTLDKNKSGQKKQGTRMLKAECLDCGAVWRMTAKHMVNVSQCPCCGGDHLKHDLQDGENDEGEE